MASESFLGMSDEMGDQFKDIRSILRQEFSECDQNLLKNGMFSGPVAIVEDFEAISQEHLIQRLAASVVSESRRIDIEPFEFCEYVITKLRNQVFDFQAKERSEQRKTISRDDFEAWKSTRGNTHKALQVESVEVDGEFIGFASLGCGCRECVAWNKKLFREAEHRRSFSIPLKDADGFFIQKSKQAKFDTDLVLCVGFATFVFSILLMAIISASNQSAGARMNGDRADPVFNRPL